MYVRVCIFAYVFLGGLRMYFLRMYFSAYVFFLHMFFFSHRLREFINLGVIKENPTHP